MAERRLALYRRKSLAGIADGWNDECYIDYRPAAVADLQKFSKLETENVDNEQAVTRILELCKAHFVRGKIRVFDEQGDETLSDMRAEDFEQLPPSVWQSLLADIAGGAADPKGIQTDQPDGDMPPSSASNTGTPSSTDSAPQQ